MLLHEAHETLFGKALDVEFRTGKFGVILKNSSPGLFRKHVEKVLDSVDHKADEHKVVILKSWNEWAEGNYMEPDLKHGRGYLEALKEALNKKQ